MQFQLPRSWASPVFIELEHLKAEGTKGLRRFGMHHRATAACIAGMQLQLLEALIDSPGEEPLSIGYSWSSDYVWWATAIDRANGPLPDPGPDRDALSNARHELGDPPPALGHLLTGSRGKWRW